MSDLRACLDLCKADTSLGYFKSSVSSIYQIFYDLYVHDGLPTGWKASHISAQIRTGPFKSNLASRR